MKSNIRKILLLKSFCRNLNSQIEMTLSVLLHMNLNHLVIYNLIRQIRVSRNLIMLNSRSKFNYQTAKISLKDKSTQFLCCQGILEDLMAQLLAYLHSLCLSIALECSITNFCENCLLERKRRIRMIIISRKSLLRILKLIPFKQLISQIYIRRQS